MAFTINTNIASLQAQEYLRMTGDFQSKTINRVTSGLRIVSAGDDAAGLAIANTFRSDQAVLSQGIRNANDGIATLQTIDGGISNIGKLLDRARSLASQSASQTFVGDRTVLNSEFQNVLSEINRQAQAIGMVTGGEFARSMSVFIGGGRTVGSTLATTNGSVTVDFSNTKLDTNSLGLGSAGVQGADMRSAAGVLSSQLGGTAPVFTFKGSGFEAGVDIDLAAAITNGWGTANIKNENDLVTKVNAAIDAVGANNAAFRAAGIRASIDSSNGKLSFTSTVSFQVQRKAASASAQALLGTANELNAGASSYLLDYTAALSGANTQALTMSWRNAAGSLQTQVINLAAANTANAQAVATAINTAMAGQGGIFAVTDNSDVRILRSDSTAFQLTIGAGTASEGVNNGAAAEGGSSSTQLGTSTVVDISNSTNAVAAVSILASAVQTLGATQASVGRAQNQLSYAVSLGTTQLTNLAASESRIRDADLAQEAANLTKAQILAQAGVAALAQANSAPQAVLSLLRG